MRDLLRTDTFKPYQSGMGPEFRLSLFDTGRSDRMGKCILGYELVQLENGSEVTLFEGEDFACSPLHAIDSDETVASLMMFLTVRPGDTDPEYFEGYTPTQLEYCEQHAESLGYEVSERYGEE